MRILVLIHEFPPVGGGGGRAAEDICRGLVERGHQVVVITAWIPGLEKIENRDGIRIIRIPSLRREAFRASLPVMAAYVLFGWISSLRFVRHWRPDVLHAHFAVPGGALAWLVSGVTKIPYVLTAHLGDVPGGVPEKTGKWFRWIYPFTHRIWRDASQVIAVSEFTKKLAQEHYPIDIQVIPNGVDLDSLKPVEITVGNPPRLIFAGRFMQQKNPLQIVRTLAIINDLPWNCVMVGDGPLFQDVEDEIETEGLKERFALPGWISPEEVLDWFSTSDILFMPSLSEGLPVVGVQALAKGLAVVASDIGGFVDIVEDGTNGYLIKDQTTQAFAKALRRVLSDSRLLLEFRQNSLEKSIKFDIKEVVSSYETILKDSK
jgi:glycosyltransferase involved in cell wall biosynthesis